MGILLVTVKLNNLQSNNMILERAFKDIKRFDLISNGKVTHFFRVIFLDDTIGLYDNKMIKINIYNNKT